MKNRWLAQTIFSGFLLFLVVSSVYATIDTNKILGTWQYEAKDAPYEYSVGQLIFTENEGNLQGKIKIGDYEIEMRDLKTEGENITFGAYVEGEYVTIKIKPGENLLTGTATYSEGTIDVKAKKDR